MHRDASSSWRRRFLSADPGKLLTVRALHDPDQARAAKLTAEAKLKEMDVADREGRTIQVADVEERWAQVAVSIREAVMAVAGTAVQAGLIKPTQEAQLETQLRDALILAAGPGGEEA